VNEELCIVAFKGAAYDSAADVYRRIEGWCVDVVPVNGDPFTAEVGPLAADHATGQYRATFYPWSDELGRGEREGDRVLELDIYDDIERVEVC
jgi:hypothetical protein